jgi:immune inhibitor A
MRFCGAGFGALCLIALNGNLSSAAPLHPDLLRDPNVHVPAERSLGSNPEVQAAASDRFGRHWTGHPRLLVLLVDFSDRPADTTLHPPAYFQQLLFSKGEVPTGSLREWYEEATYGKIEWSGEVRGWFRMPLTYAEYADNQSGYCACYPNNAEGMVVQAFQAAVAAGIDFRRFDNDGPDGIPASGDDDGIVDGFAVVFAGIGAERSGLSTDLRSHYSNTPFDLEANGIRVPDYVAFPEKENIGVPVHEIGHLLGAVDLYDLSGRAGGLGYYSVMAYGMWFNNGRQPGGPDPYTRLLWGVLEPEALQVDESGLDLPPIEDVPRAVRLWTRGESGPEYFLLEHRTVAGMDRFLFGDGLLLYHVNEGAVVQNNPERYLVDLVQADGLRTLNGAGTVRNLGEFGDYFPGLLTVKTIDGHTVPDTRAASGESTAVALRNIGDPSPRMSFDAEVGRYLAAGPLPILSVSPAGDAFASALLPAHPASVRLAIENLGTRLGGGTVRVFSRDARVHVTGPPDIQTPTLGALQTLNLGEATIEVTGIASNARAALPLEAVWESAETTWSLAAPLPLAGNVIRREGFEADLPDVQTFSDLPKGNPWQRVSSSRSHEGSHFWQTVAYQGGQDAVLQIGPLALSGAASEIRFHQKLDLEAFGDYGYDGGYLEASVDDGPWALLEPRGGYPYTFGYSDGNPYAGRPCWSGRSPWQEVVVPLTLRGNVRFRFHFVSDFSGNSGLYDGWSVDAFLLRSWDHAHAAVFQPPQYRGASAQVTLDMFPLFGHSDPERVRLLRDRGMGREELGQWTLSDRRSETVMLNGIDPWRVERLWLEWPDGDRQGPLLIATPGAARTRLLDPTPAVLRRGEGGLIYYRVPGDVSAPVLLQVFDVRGARVARLEDGFREPGSHVHPGFPEADVRGPLGAGLYFLRLTGPGFAETRRLVVLPR